MSSESQAIESRVQERAPSGAFFVRDSTRKTPARLSWESNRRSDVRKNDERVRRVPRHLLDYELMRNNIAW